MNVPALIAVNILIVGAGIMTYDVMRTDPPTVAQTADGEPIDLSTVEDRLSDLERRLDGFSTIKTDRKVTSRLLQMENRLAAMEAAPAEAAASLAATATETTSMGALESTDATELAGADLAKIKKAMEQIDKDRDRERSTRGVDRIVDRLGLQLTDDQKKRLGEEFAAFRNKIRDNFRNGRMEGQTREDLIANMETMRDEFGTSLGTFLSQTDADAIVSEIGSSMGGSRRGPGSGGFGGGGAR